jgi:HPt (histidine-containing phosphotransfer) domain-containing protein
MLPGAVHARALVASIYQRLRFAAPLKVPFTSARHLGPGVDAVFAPRGQNKGPAQDFAHRRGPNGHAGLAGARGSGMNMRALGARRGGAGATAAQSAAIDRGYLARFTMGNEALAQEVLELLAAQAPVTLDRLRRAQSEADWQQAAHTLKGSAAAVGARQLQGCAELAERVTSLPAAEREAQRLLALSLIAEATEAACRQIGQMYAA